MADAAAPCHSTVTEKGRVRIQGRGCSGCDSEIISEGVCSSALSQPQSPRPGAVEQLRDRLASRQPVFKPESSLLLKLVSLSMSHSPRLRAREIC